MMKFTLTVTAGDHTTTVTAGPATQVAFEREHNVGIASIATEQRVEHIYWLAWHASKPGVDFDKWLDSIDSIDVDVQSVGPTKPTPSAA